MLADTVTSDKQTSRSDDTERFVKKILILAGMAGIGYLCLVLLPILSILFLSGFLTLLFSPFLNTMWRWRIPSWAGLLLIYVAILILSAIALFAIVPIFVRQVSILFANLTSVTTSAEALYRTGGIVALGLPGWINDFIGSFDPSVFLEFIRSHAASISTAAASSVKYLASNGINAITSISWSILHIVMILVFTFFMSLERASIRRLIYDLLPSRTVAYLRTKEKPIGDILTAWIRGQILLGISIFFLTLAGLIALRLFGIRIEWMITLALIAWLMEFIPYIGPFLALLPALAVVAGMGFVPIMAVLVLYIAIQQIENNIIVPYVMSKALNLSPLLILTTMTVMASLFGIIGILLAIPFAALLRLVISDWIGQKRRSPAGRIKKSK